MIASSVNKELIQKCLGLVEEKVGYSPEAQWTHRNFESLSEQIHLKTGTLLSVSTLKRLWNSRFKSLPQKATLDSLAQFIDYKDWFDFVASSVNKRHKYSQRYMTLMGIALVLIITLGIVFIPKLTGSKYKDNNKSSEPLNEVEEGVIPVLEGDSAKLIPIQKDELTVD